MVFGNKMYTTHALINLDANKFSISVFIDLKKAFDTVNHALLIYIVESYGLRDPAKMWIKCYLHDKNSLFRLMIVSQHYLM